MRRGLTRAWLACVLICASACSYVPSTRLEYDPRVSPGPPSPLVIAVERLREERRPRYWASYGGRIFLSYVPLLPYFKIPYERLDESYLKIQREPEPWEEHEEHFTRKISEAIAHDLDASGMFRRVEFIDEAEPPEDVDLVLGGELRDTEFDVYVTSYMLGIAGVLLWLLPIPIGSNAATVELDLELRDREGTVLWSQLVEGRTDKLFTLYSPQAEISGDFGLEIYRFGSNDHGIDQNSYWAYHADALRKAMALARESLRTELPQLEAKLASRP